MLVELVLVLDVDELVLEVELLVLLVEVEVGGTVVLVDVDEVEVDEVELEVELVEVELVEVDVVDASKLAISPTESLYTLPTTPALARLILARLMDLM